MWAQYADNHAAVCLAFDQSLLIEAARKAGQPGLTLYKGPVRYRSPAERELHIELPLARVKTDSKTLVEELFPSVVAGLYFTKAWDFEHRERVSASASWRG
jgi:hypothetical protein